MKIKIAYVVRYKEAGKYCTTEHIELTERDLFNCIKEFYPPSRDDLYIDDDFDIEGFIL